MTTVPWGPTGAPSYRTFEAVMVGWVHCLGRRTITAVALASGAVGRRHISGFHQFFSRAADVDPAGGLALDPRFFAKFGDLRPHQIRLQGDSSSDSFCYLN